MFDSEVNYFDSCLPLIVFGVYDAAADGFADWNCEIIFDGPLAALGFSAAAEADRFCILRYCFANATY